MSLTISSTWFLTNFPLFLGGILLLTAVYNLVRCKHLKWEMKSRDLPEWLAYPAVFAELGAATLAFCGLSWPALLVATAFLAGSIGVCVWTNWQRRLWLSIPLFALSLIWWWLYFQFS